MIITYLKINLLQSGVVIVRHLAEVIYIYITYASWQLAVGSCIPFVRINKVSRTYVVVVPTYYVMVAASNGS